MPVWLVALPRIEKWTTQEERHVKKTLIALLAGVIALTAMVGGALAKSEKKVAGADICVLLPDPKSSVTRRTGPSGVYSKSLLMVAPPGDRERPDHFPVRGVE